MSSKLNLYWVETADHDEDWFVVAHNYWEAEIFHEDEEGYDRGDAEASLLAPVPESVEAEPGWPSDELLVACGAKILRNETPRVVEIGGLQYCEGILEHTILQLSDDIFEAEGQGRPNRTQLRTKN